MKRAKPLAWNEAHTTHRFTVECTDRSLRYPCSFDLPFGGKAIVLSFELFSKNTTCS